MELIPGLPDDLGRECLIRVHYTQFPILCRVCKAWNLEVHSPEFRSFRKQRCNTHNVILIHEEILDKDKDASIGRLRLVEVETGVCSYVPPIPDFPNIRDFRCYGAAIVMLSCVALFCRPDCSPRHYSQQGTKVFVFDILSWTWRQGAEMPSALLWMVQCVSDGDQMVYVACKHESRRIFGTMAYDVLKDEWRTLPDDSRYELLSKLIIHRGKIHLLPACVGPWSYPTFDVSAWQWDSHESFIISEGVDISFVIGLSDCEGAWYGGNKWYLSMALPGSTWQHIAMPHGEGEIFWATMWKNKLIMMRLEHPSLNFNPYVLDLKNKQWTKVKMIEKISFWNFRSISYLEI